jgi:hypothetical protein
MIIKVDKLGKEECLDEDRLEAESTIQENLITPLAGAERSFNFIKL